MVRERSPNRTVSSSQQQAASSQQDPPQAQQRRTPLANISVKMQSAAPRKDEDSQHDIVKSSPASSDISFGQVSPLRNPLRRPAGSSVFIPKRPPVVKKALPPDHPLSQRTGVSGFYRPSQQQQNRSVSQTSSLADDQEFTRIYQPTNPPSRGYQPPPKPKFSTLGANNTSLYPSQQQKRPATIDLTASNDENNSDNESTFNPDAIIASQRSSFGAPDPYAYVDASQANENMRKLLEGAFDDAAEPSKTRLRLRARQAAKEEAEVKSLADKLAALDVASASQDSADAQKDAEDEEEDGTVDGLKVRLLPHQVEGVAWMIDKEIGRGKKLGVLPKGGILADDMGLGKTVQSITLILTNPRPPLDAKPEYPKQKLPGKEVGKGTLVVAPLALIKQWEAEIKSKVADSHAMKVLVHHGPSRTKSPLELKKYDVVITTYQSLTSEHANSNTTVKIGCMGVPWYRIILDEAHSIKNRSAKAHQACCALNSYYRWCLTGTPLQNNLDELQALIKFLRVKPYCDVPAWKDGIIVPMKNGRGGLAMRRLQLFLQALMKRRTKDILKKEGALNFGGKPDTASADGESKPKSGGMQIVKREVQTVECDFDEVEQQFYDRLSERADAKLKDMMQGAGGKTDYIGALVLLLRLRQACNHPHLIAMAMSKDKDALSLGTEMNTPRKKTGGSSIDEMDDLADLLGGISVQNKVCDVCQIKLSAKEMQKDSPRCDECEESLDQVKHAKAERRAKKDAEKKVKRIKTPSKSDRAARPAQKHAEESDDEVRVSKPNDRRARNRRVIHDSDDEDDEEEGEWVGEGSEQHIDLGVAGGTDDEDAEGGGDTLDTIDSARSQESDGEDLDSFIVNDDGPVNEDKDDADSDSNSDEEDSSEESATDEDDLDDSQASEASEASDSDDGAHRPAVTHKFNVLDGMQSSRQKSAQEPSTKIRHLLRILHRETPQHKTIVFSQFTSMLDLIEPHLRHAGIAHVRYDGSMRPDERERALDSLRTNPRTRVLLCSLKCGSLGLNLTVASRVVIVEPFWNPFVEEQAIDRVHRLNQTVDVKVFRLTVRHSVEARILELQEKKRELAKYAIEGGQGVGKLSLEDILGLFRTDGGHDDGVHDKEDRELWEKFGSDARLLEGRGTAAAAGEKVLDSTSTTSRTAAQKPGKQGLYKEHDVYGRRW